MAENYFSDSCSNFMTEFRCDLCQIGEKNDHPSCALTFCIDCMEHLCEDCMAKHSRNEGLKTHKTLGRASFPSRITPKMFQDLKTITHCSVHEVQFGYICEDHGELICHLCTRKKHLSCTKICKIQFSPVSAIHEVEKTRNRLQKLRLKRKQYTRLKGETERLSELRRNILKQIQSFLEQTDPSNEQCTVAGARETEFKQTNETDIFSKDDLRIYEEHLLAVLELDHHEKTMLVTKYVELSTTDKKDICELEDLKDGIENDLFEISQNFKRLQTLQDIVTELVSTPSISSHSEGTTAKKVKVLETDAQPVIEVPGRRNESDLDSYVFASSDADTEIYDSSCTGPPSPNLESLNVSTQNMYISRLNREVQTELEPTVVAGLPLTRRDLEFVGSYNCFCYLDIHSECDITGVVVLKTHRVAITDARNRTIKVYDDSFNFQIALKLGRRPIDLCVANQDSETVAISFGTKRLHIYRIQAQEIVYIRGFDLGLFCRGISSVSEDIVALLATDREVFLRDGDVRSVDKSDIVEIQQRHVSDGKIYTTTNYFHREIRDPFCIQVDDDMKCIILGERNQVSAFNKDGERIWYYKPGRHSRLNMIYGMTMDAEGNAYVTGHDSNNVHQVSSQDYRCSRVIIPYIESPRSIEYDPRLERLIVGCVDSTSLSVYRFN